MYRFKRFTDKANTALNLAMEAAREMGHTYVGTEHLLLAMLKDGDGLAWHSLAASGLTYESARRGVIEEINPGFGVDEQPSDSGDNGHQRPRRDDDEEED